MARRREVNIFSMSFLDAISCGFGAIVLLFMIINANVDLRKTQELENVSAEARRVELKVLTGRKNLLQLKAQLASVLEDWATLQAVRDRLVTEIRDTVAKAATITQDSEARRKAIEKLRAELAALEAETQRLSAASITPEEAGDRIRSFQGEGNRQYLTGLRMGGKHVVILVDMSTSMLDRTIVNIIRRRNMTPDQQRRAPKWQQVVNTVDWLTTQITPGTEVQVIGFTNEAKSLIPGTDGKWVTVTDGGELETAVRNLRASYPKGPTSLHAAFDALRALEPKADNVYLLVDGLPTMGEVTPTRPGVTSRERIDHFNRAVRQLPLGVPINVILFAMEGDPAAAPAFWILALRTGGSMLAPSEDWP
jgi:von Willebrand factor type A domain